MYYPIICVCSALEARYLLLIAEYQQFGYAKHSGWQGKGE